MSTAGRAGASVGGRDATGVGRSEMTWWLRVTWVYARTLGVRVNFGAPADEE